MVLNTQKGDGRSFQFGIQTIEHYNESKQLVVLHQRVSIKTSSRLPIRKEGARAYTRTKHNERKTRRRPDFPRPAPPPVEQQTRFRGHQVLVISCPEIRARFNKFANFINADWKRFLGSFFLFLCVDNNLDPSGTTNTMTPATPFCDAKHTHTNTHLQADEMKFRGARASPPPLNYCPSSRTGNLFWTGRKLSENSAFPFRNTRALLDWEWKFINRPTDRPTDHRHRSYSNAVSRSRLVTIVIEA